MRQEIREIVASVAKPYRYLGGEVGSRAKAWDEADVRVCLAFPEVYELGMSHLGLAILYELMNREDGMLAERAFAPWADMEAMLRERGVPLFTLESHRPLADFDIIGVSLAYELTYTNALNMLSLSGIPLRASDRGEDDPMVVAGGPCAFNPEPVAPFFDAIVIGDGERSAVEMARLLRSGRQKGLSRGAIVDSFAGIPGVYLPGRGDGRPVGMARIENLGADLFPREPMCAYAATQERAAVEVSRGCARGCRFCQAGYAYRPVRQRSAEEASELAVEGLSASGKEEFSFLALSISDWAPLEAALDSVHAGCGEMEVGATLPSLRAEALTEGVTSRLGRARSGSFTLAPEAATERMRRFINKGNTDEDLYASVERVFAGGWQAIKLYFMVGLPGETEEEIEGIVRVANRCLDIGRRYHRRPNVTVSTSTFVPKPHTPFQWEAQISIERTLELQREFKKRLRRPGLFYRWHKAEVSFLEGVASRGGRELADAIEGAFRRGARFDGWDECFDLELWRASFAECGIVPEDYLEERGIESELPWEHLGAGPSKEFLLRERERASALAQTPDCTRGACSDCGICDFKELKNKLAPGLQARRKGPDTTSHELRVTSDGHRYRIRFTKSGRAAFLGQVETLDALRRAFRAAGLPLAYSEGYHPRAKVSAGPALPLGVESLAEFVDVELTREVAPPDIGELLSRGLPEGMEAIDALPLKPGSKSIDDAVRSIKYEISAASPEEAASARERFEAASSLPFTRVRREKRVDVDLKDYAAGLAVGDDGVLGITVLNLRPALKISEIVGVLFGISEQEARKVPVKKAGVEWK